MAAGDDDVGGPERVQRPREILDVVAPARRLDPRHADVAAPVAPATSTRASGRFGVITVASGSSSVTIAARASSSSSTAPDSATITGSITIGTPSSM